MQDRFNSACVSLSKEHAHNGPRPRHSETPVPLSYGAAARGLCASKALGVAALGLFTVGILVGSPPDPLAEGQRAFASGHYAEAVRLLQTAGKQSHQCEISFLLGLARYRLQQIDQSLIDLQSATACAPSNPVIWTALGEAHAEQGDDNAAILALQEALKLKPDEKDALRDSAALYLKHEMNEQAIDVLQSLVKLEPKNSQARSDLGAAYAGLFKMEEAQSNFQAALRIDPNNPSALVGLGHIELKAEHNEEAIRNLDKAIEVAPQRYEPYYLRGTAYSSAGRYADAIDDFQHTLRLGGKDPEIYYHLSKAYKVVGRGRESEQALAQFSALRQQANDKTESLREAARLTQQAKASVDRGNLPDAIAALEKARKLEGDTPQTLFRLAGLYYDSNQYELALQDVRMAIQLAPSDWSYYYLLGLIEINSSKPKEAQKSLETAVQLNPSAADAFCQLGNLAMQQKDYQQAIQRFQEASRLQPDEPLYRANLERAESLAQRAR